MSSEYLVHLHLLLNHWPIIGAFIAVGLLLVALFAKSHDMEQVALALFALIALLSIPTYLTGNLAQNIIKDQPGVSARVIATHEGAALLAFTALQITGFVAWAGLLQARRTSRPPGLTMGVVLVCSLITLGLMVVTGTTGGAIRHPEIVAKNEAASLIGALGAQLYQGTEYVVTGSSRWVWPALETLHFFGLTLLLGTTGVLNLRLLGFFKIFPAGALHRFLPWGVAGLAINVVTGMLFFLGMPFFYVFNIDFHFKIVAIVLAGATLLFHSTNVFRHCDNLDAGQDAPKLAKFIAASSMVLWIAVIVLGRYMPLFEDSIDPHL